VQPSQAAAFEAIERHSSLTLEAPTGTGKTAVGWTYLETLEQAGAEELVYITPNKTQVNQVHALHPDTVIAYGRSEYDCLYYQPEATYKADEIPCLTLIDCPHRVDVETGETMEEGVAPCPYYLAKHQNRQALKKVNTVSFYLFNNVFRRDFEPPDGLVIDEAHKIADVVRGALSYDITDLQLRRSVRLLESIDAEVEAKAVGKFLRRMVAILRRKPQDEPTLLADAEIIQLLNLVREIDADAVRRRIAEGIKCGQIDPVEDREVLLRLERLTQNLGRYLRSLDYALPAEGHRHALNLVTYAYSDNEVDDENRVSYKLIIKSYYVAGLIRKLLSPNTLAMSATIGDNVVFGYETGIQLPFVALPGLFPASNALVLLPTDTPNLAAKERSRNQPTRVLRQIARACGRFADEGLRSLVIVVSNKERQKFLWLCGEREENVNALSYGDGVNPRQALDLFKAGEGDVLVGTVSNYGEGVDLPEEMAPLAFVLRPGYPNPHDPFTQFEMRRFGNGGYWAVWNWRVMIEALQSRGRNIRSASDRGATIFISQQFRRFLYASLPAWLKDSYRGDLTFDEACDQVLELLG
jgi:Rad3-related DNA helicase